jgi:hypothetical protein
VQLSFPSLSAPASSYYCNVADEDITQYNCLILYPLGIPAQTFDVVASCTLNQNNGSQSACTTKFTYIPPKSQ